MILQNWNGRILAIGLAAALLAGCVSGGTGSAPASAVTPAAENIPATAVSKPVSPGLASATPASAAGNGATPAALSTPAAALPPTLAPPTLAPPTLAPPTLAPVVPTEMVGAQAPMPDCQSLTALTPNDMEGPYYLGDTPERSSLVEPGMSGTVLIVSGYVLHADCSPAGGARLDFWQADASGEYDVSGYALRGHLFADENGFYRLETILPAVYGGRPRHIHVKVDVNGFSLTTQLYFPGDSPSQLQTVVLDESVSPATAFYNFVIP